MSSKNIYYTYLLLHPDTNLPFYVGMGKNKRYLNHVNNARLPPNKRRRGHKLGILRKLLREGKEPIYSFYVVDVSRDVAITCEKALIAKYGREDLGTGILTNLTNGGDGRDGYSLEQRKHASNRMKNKIMAKDKDGNAIKIDKDDPRFLSGELVGVTKGDPRVKASSSKSMKNKIMAKDKDGNAIKIDKDDPRFLSGELVGIQKGKKGLADHLNNQPRIQCEKCGKFHSPQNYHLYHGEKCGQDRTRESTKMRREKLKIESEFHRRKVICNFCGKEVANHHLERHQNSITCLSNRKI